ncbi:MAG: hypothetical protein AB1451_14385 [Nitrospirota bacterium]
MTMGSTGTLTYRITNANTGGNTGERIYEVRFRVGGGGRRGGGASSTFSAATAAPAGWTRTSFSTTSVTFRANSWANAIITGSYLDFPIVFNFRQTTADTTERLRDIRARYTNSVGGPPFTNLGSDTDSNQGGWTLRSLEITSLQITDTSGVPITALSAGSSFRLVMSVTNRSTATMTAIRSGPTDPPVASVLTGTATVGWTSTVNSPNPLTLAPGASGTITYTYTTGLADSGTINFANIYARNNTGSGTSALATSPTLAIGRFTAAINVSSACLYSGQSFTVDMVLTNRYPYAIDNVTPTLTVSLAGAPLTLTSGPNPTPPNGPVPASGAATYTFTWVYLVTSAANGQTFTFDGSATGTGVVLGSPVHTTPTSSSLVTKAGGYSISANQTNGTSTNEEISWAFQNNGCAATNNVAIDLPAGWVWAGGGEDSYALVDTGVGTSSENWSALGPDPVTFTAQTVADRLYVGGQGEYRLAFSSTPTATVPTVYTFNVTITDATGAPAVTVPASVTLNPFNTGGLNDANGLIWQEQFR